MKTLVWLGKEDIRRDTVSDPGIEHPRDAFIKMASCAICGSDLHLFHNLVPAMLPGDIMGHETMGEVVEVGSAVRGKLNKGGRVDIPFTIVRGEWRADIQPGDTVAVWGCGPVGQMTVRPAIPLGAEQVTAIDHLPERLSMATAVAAIPIDFAQESVIERLEEMTAGTGPHKCIDAVGTEGHVSLGQPDMFLEHAKQMLMVETDRPHLLREMIYACRPAGVVSIIGVYLGQDDKVPMGRAKNNGLTFRMAQAHVPLWTDTLLRWIEDGRINPSFVITHKVDLAQGLEMCAKFRDEADGCIKVMLQP